MGTVNSTSGHAVPHKVRGFYEAGVCRENHMTGSALIGNCQYKFPAASDRFL
jgi:hypothetical protein